MGRMATVPGWGWAPPESGSRNPHFFLPPATLCAALRVGVGALGFMARQESWRGGGSWPRLQVQAGMGAWLHRLLETLFPGSKPPAHSV